MTGSDFKEITEDTPEKPLVVSLNKNTGRDNQGKITIHHRDDGSRRKYRIIGFKRNSEDGIPVIVIDIEYDPNKTANIALICYADGTKSYILAPQGLTGRMKVMNDDTAEAKLDNYMPLYHTPVGTQVHNIELYPDRDGRLARSADNGAQLMAKEGKYTTLRLPPGEVRMVPVICYAAVGVVDNDEYPLVNIGRAGRKRNTGPRPIVRSSVMDPNGHPHGGGEGGYGIDRPGPHTPWGKLALGLKTRKKNKQSNKSIIRRHDGKIIKQLKEIKNTWLVH